MPLPAGYPELITVDVPDPNTELDAESMKRRLRMPLGDQVEWSIRKGQKWAKTLTLVETFKKAIAGFPRVPPACLPGIIKECFPLGKTVVLCEEGPLQGYPNSQLVEYTIRLFLRTCRVVPKPNVA